MKKTAAEILAQMEEISRSEDLDVAAYEALEVDLKVVLAAEEIVKRQAAYGALRATTVPVASGVVEADDEMSRAFEGFLRTGRVNGEMVQPGMISRAQSESVGAAGGYMVPEIFQNKIISKMKSFGGLFAAADGISTSTGAPLTWLTDDEVASNLAGIVPENASNTFGQDIVVGKNQLSAYKYDTAGASGDLLRVSWELLQDSVFDLQGFIANKFAMRIKRKLAVDLVNGSGVNEPQGIISTQGGLSSSGITIASATAGPTYAELVNIEHSLDPDYREGASWLMNDKTLGLIEQLVDLQGRPLVWGSLNSLSEQRGPKTLLGYPVVIDQAMPDLLTGSTRGLVFGDLKAAFIVRTVKDVTMLQDPYSYIRAGQVGFLAYGRFDAMVQQAAAAVYVTSHA